MLKHPNRQQQNTDTDQTLDQFGHPIRARKMLRIRFFDSLLIDSYFFDYFLVLLTFFASFCLIKNYFSNCSAIRENKTSNFPLFSITGTMLTNASVKTLS